MSAGMDVSAGSRARTEGKLQFEVEADQAPDDFGGDFAKPFDDDEMYAPPVPVDPKMRERLRKSAIKEAKSGTPQEPSDDVLARAGQTRHSYRSLVQVFTKRFAAREDLDVLAPKLRAIADAKAAEPEPDGGVLGPDCTVASLLRRIEKLEASRAGWEVAGRGVAERNQADSIDQAARHVLISTADPGLADKIGALQHARGTFQARIAHHAAVVQEIEDVKTLRQNLQRWGQGALSEKERKRIKREPWDGVVQGRTERLDQVEQQANRRELDRLIYEGTRRLAHLEARSGIQRNALKETRTAEKELARIRTEIDRLRAEQLKPESATWPL